MSLLDKDRVEVKEFSFGQLIPSENENAEFIADDSFELKSLKDVSDFKNAITDELLREERAFESQSSFQIDGVVREHRGIRKQEEQELETKIAEEVAKRVEALKEQAYNEGFAKGQEDGHAQAYTEAVANFEEKISQFSNELTQLKINMDDIYNKSQNEAYLMVKNLTKWIILKEVDEKYYLARLLEKLIHEINTKNNLLLHVNEGSFGYMPEIIKIVERKLGVLPNVRVEIDYDMEGNGIVIESDNTIVDASLESQFNTIDRLFANVGVNG